MPSPFPGMDPYLEEPTLWPDVHSSLITYIREVLQPRLRPNYVARIGERVTLTDLGQGYIPDVLVVQPPVPQPGGGVATLEMVADEPTRMKLLEEERRVPYIEIVYRRSGDVVTLIEVISPSHKVGEGRMHYRQKQKDILQAQVNFVEIDLLSKEGGITLANNASLASPADIRYMVSIWRAERSGSLEAYPTPLRNRLPRCSIPLRPPDADVVLDLPAVFTRCYDVGSYDLMIDYRQPPPVSLSEEEQRWLVGLLTEKGFREAEKRVTSNE